MSMMGILDGDGNGLPLESASDSATDFVLGDDFWNFRDMQDDGFPLPAKGVLQLGDAVMETFFRDSDACSMGTSEALVGDGSHQTIRDLHQREAHDLIYGSQVAGDTDYPSLNPSGPAIDFATRHSTAFGPPQVPLSHPVQQQASPPQPQQVSTGYWSPAEAAGAWPAAAVAAPTVDSSSSGSAQVDFRGPNQADSACSEGDAGSAGRDETSERERSSGKGGRGRARGSAPTAAALSQRRYHQRQKEKRQEYEAQLKEVTRRMQEMQEENAELRLKQRHLFASMTTWQDHLEALVGNTEVRHQTQKATLQAIAAIICLATGRNISLEEAEQWTFKDYLTDHFPALVESEAKLVAKARQNPNSKEMAQLEELVDRQRALKTHAGLGSCLHCAVNQYNQQHTRKQDDASKPDAAFWARILDGLRLTKEQEHKILDSYRWMQQALIKCAEERNSHILPQLSFESAGVHRELMHKCPAARLLFHSLRSEQTTVLGFFLAVEGSLTKWQEAWLEVACYPWSPEWLQLCSLMCRRNGSEPLQIPTFANIGMDLPLLPYMTAFEVLNETVTSLGVGSQGRQAILMCPFQVVLSRYCFPTTEQEYTLKMNLMDVIVRKERTWSCWQWLQQVKQHDRLLVNNIVYDSTL